MISIPLFALQDHSYVGGVAVVAVGKFLEKPTIFYKSKETKAIKKDGKYFAVIGLSLSENAGKRHIVAVEGDQKRDFYFQIKPKSYKKQYIKLKTNNQVNLSKKNLVRYQKEQIKTKKLLGSFNKELSTDLDFISPLSGRLTSTFGKQR